MEFSKKLRKFLFPFVGAIGYRISPTSNIDQVKNFLKTLHPIEFDLIRVGSESDGGYLVPDDFMDLSYCFSPGVSNNSDFERDLAKRGIPSFLADYSVEAPPISNENFRFIKKFVGPISSDNYIEFESWVSSNSKASDELILQMDIEGSEYGSLLSCNREVLKRFRIMIIEFHGLDLIFDSHGFQLIRDCFIKLLQDFHVVHIHPNNNDPVRTIQGIGIPSLMEISFLRKDRIFDSKHATKFPHPLDRRTVLSKKDFDLPENWYSRY